ncbi:NUDIX hydrolase [Candidatus Dojkabacteria bacterium]|uniref:NUDIX hydrolase n=1 Tax=Candidatus Dojkabacteria bacterium TaxID=2099670 RepID=A0A955RJC7_9BACT|nr:NUDIX hydrolase [Candidatus Dojkabacteria bacterium]
MKKDRYRFNATFLIDADTPTRIAILKRSQNKAYAAGFCTGIGGGIGDIPGLENETIVESAYRELEEETMGEITEENIQVYEFARCKYNSGVIIHYLWGIYNLDNLPQIDPEDGELVAYPIDEIFNGNEFIPSAKAILEEWIKRRLTTEAQYTIEVEETGEDRSVKTINVVNLLEGLH